MNKVSKIKINGDEVTQMFSSFNSQNILTYNTTPSRAIDFTLTVGTYKYVPTVDFAFNYMDINTYRKIFLALNQPEFEVEYYDVEIDMVVKRKMYISEHSRSKFRNRGLDIKGVISVTFTMVSYYGYASYEELIEKAIDYLPDTVVEEDEEE